VLADAFLKNITDIVDWATAYQVVLTDAEGKTRIFLPSTLNLRTILTTNKFNHSTEQPKAVAVSQVGSQSATSPPMTGMNGVPPSSPAVSPAQ
jgi:hypothetical protein